MRESEEGMKSGFVAILLAVCGLFVSLYANAQVDHGKTFLLEVKNYRHAGVICYETQYSNQPNMVTFVTVRPELMNEQIIISCLKEMKKTKWKLVESSPPTVVDTFREARTSNMACSHIGQSQLPMIYQVIFSDYELTGKQAELVECMSEAANAPNKARQPDVKVKFIKMS
jgi:hypothetical protein